MGKGSLNSFNAGLRAPPIAPELYPPHGLRLRRGMMGEASKIPTKLQSDASVVALRYATLSLFSPFLSSFVLSLFSSLYQPN
jgi:hypothetical protein